MAKALSVLRYKTMSTVPGSQFFNYDICTLNIIIHHNITVD